MCVTLVSQILLDPAGEFWNKTMPYSKLYNYLSRYFVFFCVQHIKVL